MKDNFKMASFMGRESLFGWRALSMRDRTYKGKSMDLADLHIHLKRFMRANG